MITKSKGGKRPGAGRKSKAEELGLTERMDKILPVQKVLIKLSKLVNDGNFGAVQLWLNYYYGKPTEQINMDVKKELPLIIVPGDPDEEY